MSARRTWPIAGFMGAGMLASAQASAYPEFQTAIQGHSGRIVSCALCHTHPDGPDGVKHGQIGSLTPAELETLAAARAATAPGAAIDSPILNEFGDSITKQLGRERITALRSEPLALAGALDQAQDLDQDGISDARELLDGTHPVQPHHGSPWLLLLHNARAHWLDLVMLAGATGFALFGLSHLFRWFAHVAEAALRPRRAEEDDEDIA